MNSTFIIRAKKWIVILTLTAVTVLLYGNIVEEILYIDLPLIKSISESKLPNELLANIPQSSSAGNNKYGYYGSPDTLRIPRLGFVKDINVLEKQNSWTLSNKALASYTFGSPTSGKIGNTLVFTSTESPIFTGLNTLVVGDRIVIETNKNWKYTYKIDNKVIVDKSEAFLFSGNDLNKLYLVKEIPFSNNLLLLESSYLSLEEIGL